MIKYNGNRLAVYIKGAGAGKEPVLEEKEITENGEYTPNEGVDGFSKVTVAVPEPEILLQEKTTTENGEVVADSGYAGLSKVTVNVASGAELNIAYGDTAPEDTTKLWVNGEEPLKVVTNNQLGGTEELSAVGTTLPSEREGLSCASVGTNIYVFGGYYYSGASVYYNTILKFDTTTETITTLSATLPNGMSSTSCASVGTNIYIFGGSGSTAYNTILKFDTTTETLTTLSATLPRAIMRMGCASVGTDIYLFGGRSGGNIIDTILKFDTTTETLTTTSTVLLSARQSMGCASVGTDIYLFGGSGSSTYTGIFRYDTTTGSITTLSTSLPAAMSDMGCASVGANIYLFGGYKTSGTVYYNTILKFDTTTNTITTLSATLPMSYAYMGCASVGANIYLFGGNKYSGGNIYYNTIYEFTVAVALTSNHLLLNTTLSKNLFKIINGDTAEIEIGVNAVYRGNSEGVAEQETARLYDATQEAWVDIVTGEAEGGGNEPPYTVSITFTGDGNIIQIYDGDSNDGTLIYNEEWAGTPPSEPVVLTCNTGKLYFEGGDTHYYPATNIVGDITNDGNTDKSFSRTVTVNSDGSFTMDTQWD